MSECLGKCESEMNCDIWIVEKPEMGADFDGNIVLVSFFPSSL